MIYFHSFGRKAVIFLWSTTGKTLELSWIAGMKYVILNRTIMAIFQGDHDEDFVDDNYSTLSQIKSHSLNFALSYVCPFN